MMAGFNTQPPEGGWLNVSAAWLISGVSTHSHPKVAGIPSAEICAVPICFNTQPPEGGWDSTPTNGDTIVSFNTQPPEGGWFRTGLYITQSYGRFNTQPPEGGWPIGWLLRLQVSGFNTQPPEGGWQRMGT